MHPCLESSAARPLATHTSAARVTHQHSSIHPTRAFVVAKTNPQIMEDPFKELGLTKCPKEGCPIRGISCPYHVKQPKQKEECLVLTCFNQAIRKKLCRKHSNERSLHECENQFCKWLVPNGGLCAIHEKQSPTCKGCNTSSVYKEDQLCWECFKQQK